MIDYLEEILIEEIKKDKCLKAVKAFFKKKQLKSENINHFRDTLYFLIKENYPYLVIKFILKKQQKGIDNLHLLCLSIENSNFRVAKLLLTKGALMKYNENKKLKNIFVHLCKNKNLDTKKLSYILSIKKDSTLITGDFLCQITQNNNTDLLKSIFHFREFNLKYILNCLFAYKYKIAYYNNELQNFLNLHGNININETNELGNYPLLHALKNKNVEMVHLLLCYAKENNITLEVNKSNRYSNNPLSQAIHCDLDDISTLNSKCTEIVKLLMAYTREQNIIFELNKKSTEYYYDGEYSVYATPLFYAIWQNNIEMVKLLLIYAEKNNITLLIDEFCSIRHDFNNYDDFPLLLAIKNNNIEIVKLLIKYAEDHHIILNIKKIRNSYIYENYVFPLLSATKNDNVEMVKLIIDYAKQHNIILSYDCGDNYEYSIESTIIAAININNNEMVKLLLSYAEENNVSLGINKKCYDENYPLMYAATENDFSKTPISFALSNNYIEIAKILINYAKENNILLKYIQYEYSPLLYAIKENNIEIMELLMEYITKMYSISILNKKWYGEYPLLYALKENNRDAVKLFMTYANKNNVILEINDYGKKLLLNTIINKNKNIEMVKLFVAYAKENNINIGVNENYYNDLYLHSLLHNTLSTTIEISKLIRYSKKNNYGVKINDIAYDEEYPLLYATKLNNTKLVQLLIDYSKENTIDLQLNKKDEEGNSPFLYACSFNNTKIVQLLMEYANETHIFLDINLINDQNQYPLFLAIQKKNIELVQLIINYADENNIILKFLFEQWEITEIYDINKTIIEIFNLLLIYTKKHHIQSHIYYFYHTFQFEIIMKMIKNNDARIIKFLKEYNIILDLNVSSSRWWSDEEYENDIPISYAIKKDNIEMIKILMDYARENNIHLNLYHKTPLIIACSGNKTEIVRLLLDFSSENNSDLFINDFDQDNKTPIFYAIEENNTEIVKMLIDYAQKNNIILKNNYTNIPLSMACSNNNTEIVRLLLTYANENNNSINLEINKINDSLSMACSNNNTEMVKLLLNYANENNIEMKINYPNNNPIVNALKKNNIEIVKLLVDYSRKKNIPLDLSNCTKYIHDNINQQKIYSIKNDETTNIIKLLMSMHNSTITTILLSKALKENNIEIAKYLIQYSKENHINFEINKIYNKRKDSLFINACLSNATEIVKFFIEYVKEHDIILDINLTNYYGNNPLLYAIHNNNVAMVKILMEYSIENNIILDINHNNKKGDNPLMNAIKYDNIDMVKCILAYAKKNNIVLELNADNNNNNNILLL
ncbi:hypothetical protein PIROE2DRAFT_59578 [Piromyces sp. E2]|nr:hypothetical protein PIROE2DRAFT_59578 [Piromyces sp. E2]|eukprot:OUM66129.1 hypothetical protein PIROE2DRAFT_59578 [Piromyces sp. E2]